MAFYHESDVAKSTQSAQENLAFVTATGSNGSFKHLVMDEEGGAGKSALHF